MADENRDIVRVSDAEALADAAAQRLLARIEAQPNRAAICLTGGSSPKRLYQLLAEEPYRSRIPWPRVDWFIGDDRFVSLDDPLSNMGMAKRAFLDRYAPPDRVHPMPVEDTTPESGAERYATMLKTFYGSNAIDPAKPLFDLVLMGIGPDGHTASLFPGYPAIEETSRWVVGVEQAHVAPFVPRITLTLHTLAACAEMLFLVSGHDKQAILARVLEDPKLPAARARSMNKTTFLVDTAAMPEPKHD
jgi:6-phosphogluconolactonase